MTDSGYVEPEPVHLGNTEGQEDWRTLGGDAGKANGEHFHVRWRPSRNDSIEIEIHCPTFLRGELRMVIAKDGRIGGSY